MNVPRTVERAAWRADQHALTHEDQPRPHWCNQFHPHPQPLPQEGTP